MYKVMGGLGKEDKKMETNGNYSGLWKGLMVGSVLGAAAGILLAPRSGKELRSEIKERTNRAFDETKRLYEGGCTKLNDAKACFSRIKGRVSASHIESPEEIMADA